MSEAGDKRDQRRRQILEAAKEVFVEKGFYQASITDIIQRAEIARGTFYLYFRSKEALFESILDLTIQGLRRRIKKVAVGEGAPAPGVQLHDNVSRVLEYVLGDRALVHLVLDHGLAPDTEVAQRVDAFFEDVRSLIEASVEYGLSVGLVAPCDPKLIAAAALGAIQGAVRHIVSRNREPDIAKTAQQLIAFSLRGVGVTFPVPDGQ